MLSEPVRQPAVAVAWLSSWAEVAGAAAAAVVVAAAPSDGKGSGDGEAWSTDLWPQNDDGVDDGAADDGAGDGEDGDPGG